MENTFSKKSQQYEKQILWGGIALGIIALWYFGMLLSSIAFLVIFSLLIILHELGHFWAARKGGVQVEEFGFGLPPKVWEKKTTTTIPYTENGKQKTRTETMSWTLNAFPIGGFVKMLGEDETQHSENPHAFSNRPLHWRILIVCGGVIMNFLLGWGLLTLGYTFGITPLAPTPEQIQEYTEQGIFQKVEGVMVESVAGTPAEELGFKRFDVIQSINGRGTPSVRFYSLMADSLLRQEKRTSATINISRFNSSTKSFDEQNIVIPLSAEPFFFPSALQTKIISLVPKGKAEKAGLKPEDRIMKVDETFISNTENFLSVLEQKKKTGNSEVHLSVKREGSTEDQIVIVSFDREGHLGVQVGDSIIESKKKGVPVIYDGDFYAPIKSVQEVFWKAPITAFQESCRFIGLSVNMVGDLVVKILTKFTLPAGVGGPVSIAHTTGMLVDQGDFSKLVQFTAILSLSLAVINIMPFPALDGGRLIFLLMEGVLVLAQMFSTKMGWKKKILQKVPPAWEAPLHIGGYALLLILIAIISWQDIVRIFFS
ncbi:MAG: RIP metalloprotease RseP [Candidatus Peregrinibacteria bacterium]